MIGDASPLAVIAFPVIGLLLTTVDPRITVAAATACGLDLAMVVPPLIDRPAFGGPRPDRLITQLAVWGLVVATMAVIGVRRAGDPIRA